MGVETIYSPISNLLLFKCENGIINEYHYNKKSKMKVIIKTLANVLLIFLINISYAKSENIIKVRFISSDYRRTFVYWKISDSISQMGINKINNKNIIIFPRDTKSNPEETFRVVEELYNDGIRIFIGPIFKTNTENLNKFQDAIFLSLTNKTLDNPSNVISTGIIT